MQSTFADFKLNKQLLTAIEEAGYTEPTPIQEKAITPILAGQDIMGVAQTGTGKTAAFILPILMRLKYAQGQDPRALILVPTRELAMQITEDIKILGKYTDLRPVVLYGGVGPRGQIEALQQGVDILVSTPGRFLDLYSAGHIFPKTLQFLVLDEADKMMDMGFIGAIHRILEVVPRKRQNLLFSATMSELVHKIAGDFLAFPLKLEVSVQGTPAETISQSLYYAPNQKTKINILLHLLNDEESLNRLIVFCRTRASADNVYSFLSKRFGVKDVRVIHANKGQNTRINSISAFKEGKVRILVATDVAARGLDIEDVSHVINFEVPVVIEDYVHRIGRTGRASKTGKAITFSDPSEEYYIKEIEKLIKQEIPVVDIPKEVFIEQTSFSEQQIINRAIDVQKRKADPSFMGAFHEKKRSNQKTNRLKSPKRSTNRRGRTR